MRRLIAYNRARRAGLTIDYARVFNADERAILRAILEEHMESAPWGKS